MISPTKVFQLSLGEWTAEVAKRDALARVEEHSDPDWRTAALAAVKRAAMENAELTTDQAIEILAASPVSTHEGRAWGAVMLKAARTGWIEATGTFVPTKRVSRHGAPVRVWRSLLYRGAVQTRMKR